MIRRPTYFTIFTFLFSFSLPAFIIFPVIARAETIPGGVFLVRPAKVELSLPPSTSGVKQITLSNGTPIPLHVEVSFEDVAPNQQSSAIDDPIKLLGTTGGVYPLKQLFSEVRG